MMMVVVVTGLIMLVAFPKIRMGMITSSIRSARGDIVAMHSRARTAAVQYGKPTYVAFSGNRAVVLMRVASGNVAWADSLGGVQDLADKYGVSLRVSQDTLKFDPRGFGVQGGSVYISRSGDADTITVSGFGRVVQ
jgi:Tfp pilus assembly protein FimT